MFSKLGNDNFRSMQFSDGRDVHRMKPSYLRGEIPAQSQYKGTQARTFHWIALPYFSVEPYSGLEAGARSASAVPAPTCYKFSHVAKSRDLRQTVCGIGNYLQQEVCLHVPQLWCLIFDNALMVTYINLPDKYFPGDYVINTTGSLDVLAGVSRTKKILALTSRFSEFWPQKFELLHNKRKITAKHRPAIWDRARHVKNHVKLELYLGARLMVPQRGRLLPHIASKGKGNMQSSTSSAHEDASTKPGTAGDGGSSSATVKTTDGRFTNANGFAIFTCMTGVSTPNSDDSVEDALLEQLVEIRDWLLYMPSFGDAKAYKSCTKDTRASVRSYLEKRAAELSSVESQGQKDQRAQRDLEDRIDIFHAAETIFEKREGQHRYQASMYTIRHQLRMQALDLSQLSEILSAARGADRAQITVPTQIIDAWIHLLLGLASFPRDSDRSERLIGDARRAATEGANIIITSLSPKSLVENSVILPLEIFSLISLKVIQSAPNVPDSPSNKEKANTYSDVAQIYRNRLDKIETDISKRPSDRANEENLRLVREEIQAILQTLLQQYVIFCLLLENANHAIDDTTTFKEKPIVQAAGHSSSMPVFIQSWSRDREPGYRGHQHRETEVRAWEYGREHSKFDMYDNPCAFDLASEDSLFKVKPTDPGGYRTLLLLECHSKTDLLKQELHQLGARHDKIRQDKAIYAFTIVTVIFLPLSAISSIFGMNTADIRDMEDSQWIYWATAIPVTLAVILFGLCWMGELGNTYNLGSWMFRKVAGDREKGREIVDRWFGQTGPVSLGLPSHIQPAYPIGPKRRPTYHPGRPARSVSSDESVDIRYRSRFV
ncbi:LOW QUALITY PROTEIN: hypothetical protein QC761_503640 [Podospora bellae-mahoneyi]|uniref:Uncharacterized protein n=1 Tax=Podospora bellae-mahoneyi TaxID=2093777 RepID=A0ABR0FFV6_9PEZI|nr:LOW QUALITY PROTEIN: hypothetical protein QC761_503640 [Podospora bellae-mahoneyi]